MPFVDHPIQRYRRTDQGRIGEWQPVDSSWKWVASAGLVAHDLYHHHPDDEGTFAQEVAALGAEWYVDIRPLDGSRLAVTNRAVKDFERSATDSLLNALDSNEKTPFLLPDVTAAELSAWEMKIFRAVSQAAYDLVLASEDPRARVRKDFLNRFVLNLLWGYDQARARFPDQRAVRAGSGDLKDALMSLGLGEVPYGHEIAIKLSGYTCTVEFTDADATFLAENDVVTAVWMPWYSGEPRSSIKGVTLHASVEDYLNYIDRYFASYDPSLPDEDQRVPENESHALRKAYVTSPKVRAALAAGDGIHLPLSLLEGPQSPRGLLII